MDPRPAVIGSTRLLLDRYLKNCTPGVWVDHFSADGKPLTTTAPASTLYHIFLAFTETLRLKRKLG
jgi:N-acylglucosamine 2-epimerase/mannose-6-phosphate isomerase